MDIEIVNNSYTLQYAVHYKRDDKFLCDYEEIGFRHTRHSFKRAAQRCLRPEKIAAAIEFGDCYYRQGLSFYVLGEQNIPEQYAKEKDKLKNTVVVVNPDTGLMLTCYRSPNPHKHVKHKSKQLYKDKHRE